MKIAKYFIPLLLLVLSFGSIEQTFCQNTDLLVQLGHSGAITCVSVSPDGRFALSGSNDHTIKLWDLKSSRLLGNYMGHKGMVYDVSFAPDGTHFYSCGADDNEIMKWSIDKEEPLIALTVDQAFTNVQVSCDGNSVIFNGSTSIYKYTTSSFKVLESSKVEGIVAVENDCNTKKNYAVIGKYQKAKIGEANASSIAFNWFTPDFEILLATIKNGFCYSTDGKKINITDLTTKKSFSFPNQYDEWIKDILPIDTSTLIIGTKDAHIYLLHSDGSSQLLGTCEDWIDQLVAVPNQNRFISTEHRYTLDLRSLTIPDVVKKIGAAAELVYAGAFNTDKNELLLTTWNPQAGNSFVIWDTHKGKPSSMTAMNPDNSRITAAAISEINRGIYAVDNQGGFHYYNYPEGNRSMVSNVGGSRATCVVMTNFQKTALFGTKEGQLVTWRADQRSRGMKTFEVIDKPFVGLQFTSNFEYLVASVGSGYLALINPQTVEIIWDKNTHGVGSGYRSDGLNLSYGQSGDIIMDGEGGFYTGSSTINSLATIDTNLIVACGGYRITLLRISDGEIVRTIEEKEVAFGSMNVSPDGSLIAAGTEKGEIFIYEVASGKLIHRFKAHDYEVRSLHFTEDNSRLYSAGLDAKTIIWDLASKTKKLTMISANSGTEYIMVDTNSMYVGTRGGLDLLSFKHNGKIFPFGQFDLQYNRPDIIYSNFDGYNQGTIDLYHSAYLKRLEKSNISGESFTRDLHVPEIELLNLDQIKETTKDSLLTLSVKASDSKYALNRINVWVNGVPIFGRNGFELEANKKLKEYTSDLSIALSEGVNMIELSVLNEAGVESLKENFKIQYIDTLIKRNLYFIGIGACKFKDASMNLDYADKDIRDIAAIMAKSEAFNHVYIDTFLNKDVNITLFDQLTKKLKNASVNDEVIVMYSGHGVLDSELNYYLSAYDIDFHNPAKKGIPYDRLDDFLDELKPRKKLVLIDACHSGEIDKDETEISNEPVAMGIAERETGKGDLFKTIKSQGNSFELMKELFSDLRRGTGTTVISSSSGKYFSFESDTEQNGIYTHALKLALNGAADSDNKDGISVSELNKYLLKKVYDLTNGKQKPTVRQENIYYDFRVY